MLRPASWLALLSRTFTFELSLAGSPRANVEYNYVDKQSIPTAGLSPASPTALWAAVPDLTPSTGSDPLHGSDPLQIQPRFIGKLGRLKTSSISTLYGRRRNRRAKFEAIG